MALTDHFFAESLEQSRIKSRIVAKYFGAWARVILPTAKVKGSCLAYLDLFAGPGGYADGTPSTPIMVLQDAIKHADLRNMLVTIFNDKRRDFAASLQQAIDAIPGVATLRYKPVVQSEEVGEKIVAIFRETKLMPTLFFADPWGYKGLSVSLIASVLQNWGCDCVFFFNYNRINPGLNNEVVREHMNDLFGESRTEVLRRRLVGLAPEEREDLIIEELSKALGELGVTYVLPFTFKNEQGTRTKHHLIFASRKFKGYEIMKEIMARESSQRDQGVGSFEYSPASTKYPTLFELTRPLDDLEEMLCAEFAGQTLSMLNVYERHNVGRPYVKANYKSALIRMEAAGSIKADPSVEKRPKKVGKPTFGDDVIVTFRGDRK